MSSHDAIQHLMRNPSAHVKFLATGRLPRAHEVHSPLIELLEKIGPGRLQHIQGLTIDARMGYVGSRDFPWASQALLWLKPRNTMFSSPASESHQDKRFQKKLYLEDLQACCKVFPERLVQELRHLAKPDPLPARIAPRP